MKLPPQKKSIHPVMLFFCSLCILFLSSFEFLTIKVPEATNALTYVTLSLSFLTFVISSCIMGNSISQIICLLFLLDNILAAYIMGAIGIVGLSVVISKENS